MPRMKLSAWEFGFGLSFYPKTNAPIFSTIALEEKMRAHGERTFFRVKSAENLCRALTLKVRV